VGSLQNCKKATTYNLSRLHDNIRRLQRVYDKGETTKPGWYEAVPEKSLADFLGKNFEMKAHFDYTYHMPSGDPRPYVYTLFQKLS
jgi:hypothetical protein